MCAHIIMWLSFSLHKLVPMVDFQFSLIPSCVLGCVAPLILDSIDFHVLLMSLFLCIHHAHHTCITHTHTITSVRVGTFVSTHTHTHTHTP